MKKNWNVEMRCTITKQVHLSACTEEEANENPWDYADDEVETEQIDWEIVSMKEDK
jgi:hypothetical protein